MRPIDIESPPAAAQNHDAAASTATAKTAEPAARRASSARTSTRTAPNPWTTASWTPAARAAVDDISSARSSTRAAAKSSLFAAFPHPLIQFVGAHAKHAHTGVTAGKRNRFGRGVRSHARHRHSGGHDLVGRSAIARIGQTLHYRQTLESPIRSARAWPLVGALHRLLPHSLLSAREQRDFKIGPACRAIEDNFPRAERECRHFSSQLVLALRSHLQCVSTVNAARS